MIRLKTEEEIKILRAGGRRLAAILAKVSEAVRPGITTGELDDLAYALIRKGGDQPAFLNYRPAGTIISYPASLCVSVNEEIVHGIPNDRKLVEGDIVGLDLGLEHQGFFTDMAVTVPVGKIDKESEKLLRVTKEALMAGIMAVKAGARLGDVGFAIEQTVKPFKFGVIKDLSGHGVGYSPHEEPYIPNFGRPGKGELLKPGMVLALEPMITLKGEKTVLKKDGWTFATADGSRSAHFEHTIAVTDGEPIILTEF